VAKLGRELTRSVGEAPRVWLLDEVTGIVRRSRSSGAICYVSAPILDDSDKTPHGGQRGVRPQPVTPLEAACLHASCDVIGDAEPNYRCWTTTHCGLYTRSFYT
jgi:hypothetical protein